MLIIIYWIMGQILKWIWMIRSFYFTKKNANNGMWKNSLVEEVNLKPRYPVEILSFSGLLGDFAQQHDFANEW